MGALGSQPHREPVQNNPISSTNVFQASIYRVDDSRHLRET